MEKIYQFFPLVICVALQSVSTYSQGSNCIQSVTTASGSHASQGPYCSGDLIFEDNFDTLDRNKWQHENTLAGGGNWEFQWYTRNHANSFASKGHLHLKATLTADCIGEHNLTSGHIKIPENECTQSSWFGCERSGTPDQILNPVRSGRIQTIDSFAFKYGRVEINAQLPTGDWLWPALWFMPKQNVYGGWPRSGEIDLMESRGNLNRVSATNNSLLQSIGSTIHFGPTWAHNGQRTAHYTHNVFRLLGNNFHRYQLNWTPTEIRFSIDDQELGTVLMGDGLWARGGFAGSGESNPWVNGTLLAPFDEEFYVIMNLAVGGTNGYFPDSPDKPWINRSPSASRDFWNGRSSWLPSWKLNEKTSNAAAMVVDYVRIWAI